MTCLIKQTHYASDININLPKLVRTQNKTNGDCQQSAVDKTLTKNDNQVINNDINSNYTATMKSDENSVTRIDFKTVGIYGKYNDASVTNVLNKLTIHLEEKGINVLLGKTTSVEISEKLDNLSIDESICNQLDLAIVIGGDGTLLHAARALAPSDVPIIGVNLGRLGFLTDIAREDMITAIDCVLQGEYRIEERLLLKLEVEINKKIIHSDVAFNEFVIGRDSHEKLLNWQCHVNGVFLTSARSDGVIISTPTGSTAYALSAGGPILQPQLDAVVMVPVSPHTLSNRPIVLPASSRIEFNLDSSNMDVCHISADGLISFQPEGNEIIRIERSENRVRMVKPASHDYYAMLRSKLGWGEINGA